MIDLKKASGTKRRVFGATFLLPVVFAVWYDQELAGLVLPCVALVMGLEMKRIADLPRVSGYLFVGLIIAQSIPHWVLERPSLIIHGFAVLTAVFLLAHTHSVLVGLFAGLLSLCLGYTSFLLLEPSGHVILVSLGAVIAACDITAYFVGRGIGGAKLWQQVSPNKTISGSIGGLIAAIGFTLVLADVFDLADKRDAMVLGLGIGILAQAGDLLESAIKRQLKVKDSGSILPGHGGMLDRFDGYLLVVPLIYLFLFSM